MHLVSPRFFGFGLAGRDRESVTPSRSSGERRESGPRNSQLSFALGMNPGTPVSTTALNLTWRVFDSLR